MLSGVTAFLEAIDQKFEAIADQHERADAELNADSSGSASDNINSNVNGHHSTATGIPASSHAASTSYSPQSPLPLQQQQHRQCGSKSSTVDGTGTPAAVSLGTGRAHLFPSTSGVESLRLQCASLQQAVTNLEEQLQQATAALEERADAERELRERLNVVEAERSDWQREAAYYKDTATRARDELAKRESDVSGLRQAAEDAAAALEAYRGHTRELLDGRDAEARALKQQIATLCRGGDSNASLSQPQQQQSSSSMTAELETTISRLQAVKGEDEAEKARLYRAVTAAAKEREEAQQRQRALEEKLDILTLECRGQAETLEGEAVVRAELEAQLKKCRADLQAARGLHSIRDETTMRAISVAGTEPPRGAKGTVSLSPPAHEPSAADGNAVAWADLEKALSEAQQRCQVLSFQLLERDAALAANSREMADWRSRYNALARRIGDEEIAAAAGYGARVTGLAFPKPPPSVRGGGNGDFALAVSGDGGSSGSSGFSELKRAASMVHLARHGRAGRLAVELMARLDEAALRLAQPLGHRPVARVAVEGYLCMLQWWVLLLFAMNVFFSTGTENGAG